MECYIQNGKGTDGPFLTENVEIVEKTDGYIRGANDMGYGSKIVTRWMIRRHDEKRFRRVYCTQWGNSGSHWIILNGEKVHVSIYY